MVRVMGWGKALRIDFEDVLVNAELMYQTKQSAYCMCKEHPTTKAIGGGAHGQFDR